MSFRLAIIITMLILASLRVDGQQLYNGGLEGPPQKDFPPPDWLPCKYNSTPDTHPDDVLYVTVPASEGNTYLGLVTRGRWGDYKNSTEACGTSLTEPLRAGACYRLLVDLYNSKEVGHYADWTTWQSYSTPVMLKIWGGNDYCQFTELFVEEGPVANENWQTYEFYISTDRSDIDFLIFEADWVGSFTYYGNIMIDNVRLENVFGDVDLGEDRTVCEGEEITLELSTTEGFSYVWQDGSTGPDMIVTDPGLYWVEMSNDICTMKDSVYIETRDCVRCNMSIPNAFTPNGDGRNDTFRPISNCEMIHYQLYIHNRLGELVFKSDDIHQSWDGEVREGAGRDDVYVYFINYTVEDWGQVVTIEGSGNIMILK
jgi:gliding motility-associated-like protein